MIRREVFNWGYLLHQYMHLISLLLCCKQRWKWFFLRLIWVSWSLDINICNFSKEITNCFKYKRTCASIPFECCCWVLYCVFGCCCWAGLFCWFLFPKKQNEITTFVVVVVEVVAVVFYTHQKYLKWNFFVKFHLWSILDVVWLWLMRYKRSFHLCLNNIINCFEGISLNCSHKSFIII